MHTIEIQWRNDWVAAASSDGGDWWYGASTVLEFLVINFSVCLMLLSNCYIHCVSKKQDTKLLPITSPNVNRFSKFFHW